MSPPSGSSRPLEELRYALAEGQAAAPPSGLSGSIMSVALGARRPGRPVPPPEAITPVRAFERRRASFSALLEELAPAEWLRPTIRDLTVQGLVGHLVGVERHFQSAVAGLDQVADVDHIDATQPFVAAQEGRPVGSTLAEWREATGRTIAVLSGAGHELDAEVAMHGMRMPLGALLLVRVFELWIHEEDVRRATHRPLSAPDAATLALMTDLAVRLLPIGLSRAGRVATGGVRLVLTGPGGGTWPAALDAGDGTAVRIVADAAQFCRVVGDRVSDEDLAPVVTGDPGPAHDLLVAARALALD
ncbi:MAG TPA: maleylpyruvate isomerase family mycothiol-dependent enzyme [Acidimicrobiales bacterium]|nr:maleylpyruvate isomerase family mycothiol-dependent enzyme [Acidimicrobiales bacterium]